MFVTSAVLLVLAAACAALIASRPGRLFFVRRVRDGRSLRWVFVVAFAAVCLGAVAALLFQSGWGTITVAIGLVAVLAAALVTLSARRVAPEPVAGPRVVLAIGAHPDDLELACGGTLAQLADAGHEVHAIVMSQGSVGGDATERPDEAQRGAAFLGMKSIEVFDFPDTQLELTGRGLIEAIEAAIDRYNPGLILTHSRHDQHQDHQAVHVATLRAARQHHSILCFESPSATREFDPDVFFDVDAYVGVKVQGVLTHRNQAGKPYMSGQVVESIAGFRGRQAKVRRAEAFETVRLVLSPAEAF